MLLRTLLVVLAFCSANAQVKYSTVIAVYNSTNDNVVNCSSGTSAQYTISELPLEKISSGTLLRLCSSSFTLTKNLSLNKYLENIAFVGNNFPILRCENEHVNVNVGISLENVHHLELHNFTIIGCGVTTTIDKTPDHNIKASVVIQYSTDISMTGITISNSPGTGLALFYNNGSINVEKCVFESNGLDKETGGNGVYVETGPSNLSVVNGLVANYSFKDCKFLFNKAVTGKDSIIKGFSRFDKGGGLCLYVLISENSNFTISHSMFIGNEADHYGGGMFVSYIGKARNNNVRVLRSDFLLNRAQFGGAMYAGYLHTRVPFETPLNCSYFYESLNISENTAQFGGGSSIFPTKTLTKTHNFVNFVNCTWRRNVGQYGSAISVLPNAWNLYTEGYLPTPRFIGCTIANNQVKGSTIFRKGNYAEYSKGSGAFYCYGHNISFEQLTLFEDNKGSGMYLGSCLAIFHKNSITYFVNNTGYQGGAIYELSSVIYVQDNSTVYFAANEAEDKGGAIYEHTFFMHIYDYSKTCFLDYVDNINEVTERNITVTFIDNFAKYGHSIYASSLRPCYNRFSFSAANLSVDIFDQVGNFTYYPENRPYEITTAINHSNITAEDWSQDLFFIPGKSMKLPFVDIDDLDQKVRTNYLVTIYPNASVTTPRDYADITSNVLLLYGKGEDTATITLSDTSSRQIALSFNITMEACPPGFIHDDDSQACVCSVNSDKSYIGIDNCKETLMRAYSRYGYWIGYLDNTTENEDSLISAYFPTQEISESNRHMLPEHADRQHLDSMMCDESRTGFLCSQCKDNLTVHYHSWKFACKSDEYCNIGWLFYILSEIIPITIIFVFIIVFNISLTSGLVNGFMFYCQVIGVIHLMSSNYLPFSAAAQVINKIHSLIYMSTSLYLFNLEDLSFCLWKDASPLSLAAFTNISLLYAFILVFVVTFAVRNCSYGCCSYRRRFLGYTPLMPNHQSSSGIIHGLIAFLLLCYAQCCHSSSPLLLYVDVYSGGPTYFKSMVYFQPDIEWLSDHHVPYVILSSLLIFFILFLPPTLLLIYPLHYRVLSFLRIAEYKYIQVFFSPLEKLKPFFDSFQSCFKDEFRFFSGLYFVYRLSMFVILANTTAHISFFLIEIQLVIMFTLHAICQPYKKRLHNVIDTLLFCNLATINAIIYYNVTASTSNVGGLNLSVTLWLQIMLTCLPLPFILVCVLVHIPCVRACHRKQTSRSDYLEEDFPDRLIEQDS